MKSAVPNALPVESRRRCTLGDEGFRATLCGATFCGHREPTIDKLFSQATATLAAGKTEMRHKGLNGVHTNHRSANRHKFAYTVRSHPKHKTIPIRLDLILRIVLTGKLYNLTWTFRLRYSFIDGT